MSSVIGRRKRETRYTRSGSVHLAYQVLGEGPPDLVFVSGWVSHIELSWEWPESASARSSEASPFTSGRGSPRWRHPTGCLVSSTVRDLVAGSGLRFQDRGVHALRGVPGEWRLFAVERLAK